MADQDQQFYIETGTPGWFQKLDADGKVVDNKFRKPKTVGDESVYANVKEAQKAFKVMTAVNGAPVEPSAADAAEKAPTTVSETGKILVGKTLTIKCQYKTGPGNTKCGHERVIKPQDAFQVKFCATHQKQHRRDAQKAKRKQKAAERKAAKAAA